MIDWFTILYPLSVGVVAFIGGYLSGSTFNVDNRNRIRKEIETEQCSINGGRGANGRGSVTIESMDAGDINHLAGAKGARASGTVSVTGQGDDDE